jgi:hypothetical protein
MLDSAFTQWTKPMQKYFIKKCIKNHTWENCNICKQPWLKWLQKDPSSINSLWPKFQKAWLSPAYPLCSLNASCLARMGEGRGMYRVLVGKPEGNAEATQSATLWTYATYVRYVCYTKWIRTRHVTSTRARAGGRLQLGAEDEHTQ